MKGLLLKDLYLMKSILLISLLTFGVLGIGFSFLTTPWVFTILAAAMMGRGVISTIMMDKSSGWFGLSAVLPVPQRTVFNSKYAEYLLLSALGLTIGFAAGLVLTQIQGNWDARTAFLFFCLSVSLPLFSGSFVLPCTFLWNEEKSIIGTIISYPVLTVIFIFIHRIVDDIHTTAALLAVLSLLLYLLSWFISSRYFIKKDII